MINETLINQKTQQLYDYFPTNISGSQVELNQYESPFFMLLTQKVLKIEKVLLRKIKRQQNRPSILKIEDSGRNVRLYSCSLYSNNTEKPENDTQ